jgi:glycosidase
MKKLHILFFAFVVILFSLSLNSYGKKKETATAIVGTTCKSTHLDWTRNAVMYEVNVRQYSKEGTFKAVEKEIPHLQKLGVNILWFMPIHPISEKDRKGTLGSPYAVQNYLATNPEFGTIEDFKSVVKKAHNHGMKVIIDWVGNHTGRDNVWIKQHPNWYIYDKSGEIVAPHDWTDVAKLNYENPEMRTAMIDAMKFWIKETDIDGFRCDAAIEVPLDFWIRARKELDAVKPMFMLAEAWEPELVNEGAFDMFYGWDFHHIMNEIAKGNNGATSVTDWLNKQNKLYCNDAYAMHFITNHDENSWNGTEFERMQDGVNAFAVLTYTLPGMPLIYTGQEVGMNKRFKFFEKDPIENFTPNKITAFYIQLNQLKHQHPALAAGLAGGTINRIETTADDKVFAFSRTVGKDEVVVIVNLNKNAVSINLSKNAPTGSFKNFFSKKEIDFTHTKTFDLKPWEYLVYVKK